jgi:hypothetical protein
VGPKGVSDRLQAAIADGPARTLVH